MYFRLAVEKIYKLRYRLETTKLRKYTRIHMVIQT